MPTITRVRLTRRRNVSYRSDQITYEQSWKIWKETDGAPVELDPTEVLAALKTAEGVDIGSAFPNLPGVRCPEILFDTPEEIDSQLVTARYEVPKFEEQPDDVSKFEERSKVEGDEFGPKFSWSGQIVQEYAATDLDEKPWINTAGDPIEPSPIDVPIQTIRITTNEFEKPDTSDVGTCEGKLLLVNVAGDSEFHTDKQTGTRTMYFVVTREVWKHPFRDWKNVERLNVGYKELVWDSQARNEAGNHT